MDKKLGQIIISESFLADALNLPEGTRIKEIHGAGDPHTTDYVIIVESDLLRGVRAGQTIPVVEPVTRKARCGHIVAVEPPGWSKK